MSDERDNREDRRAAGEDRRSGDPGRRESDFTDHVRAADAGISMVWRWGTILVILIGFGITIGVILNKFDTMQAQITTLNSQFSGLNSQFSSINRDDAEKDAKIAQLERDVIGLQNDIKTLNQVDRVLGERIAETKGEIRRER